MSDAPFPPLDVDLPCAAPGIDPEDWHPHPHGFGARHRHAVALCYTCPIRPQCRDYAMARPDLHGIFGGTTEGQRRDLRRGGPRPKPPVTVHGYTGYGYRLQVRHLQGGEGHLPADATPSPTRGP
jgi:hypothetical protein